MIKAAEVHKALIERFKLRERRLPKTEHTHPDIYDDTNWNIYLECDKPPVYITTTHFPSITIEHQCKDEVQGGMLYNDAIFKNIDEFLTRFTEELYRVEQLYYENKE